ncbi:MAG: shikimate dehydrogenase [Verrucomicrobiota bacterium]|jgi:shikimate dehydrogenase
MKEVYTLDDLSSRDLLDAGCDKPARLAVIGWPIAHSASPMMHQAALDAYGIDCRYIRVEVPTGSVSEAFQRMRSLGFIGVNVTVPHKFDALALCDVKDPLADALGAVNTVKFDAKGLMGFNTDGPGFVSAIEHDFSVRLADLKVLIVGAGGGAGQAIATQCILSGVRHLVLVNRSVDKIAALQAKLQSFASDAKIIVSGLNEPHLSELSQQCDLIVNTSSVGLKSDDPCVLPATCLMKNHMVYDTIYKPAVTPLISQARSLGCRTSNGLSMLLGQGALAFQHWFPGTDPLPLMREALIELS